MTMHRALLAYLEILRNFQNQLWQAPSDVEGALEVGMGYLMQKMRINTVALFWWDPARLTFTMQYELHEGTLMEGEEEISLGLDNPLQPLVTLGRPVVVRAHHPWVAFFPLEAGGTLLGAVRLVRDKPLPRGRVLRSLPPYHAREMNPRTFPLLEDIADLLSVKLQEIASEKESGKKAQHLQAGTEVARAMSERPRLKDMLEAVSETVIQNFGLDRIRFYLIEPSHFELRGVAGFQIPGRTLDLETEAYPLESGSNTLVEATLSEHNGTTAKTAGGCLAYIPLIAKGQVIGCMAVDNLLSQQKIEDGRLASLTSLAGLIGTAVQNARLFEDIEQQAITDGLTKLYVFRYFQQRLKEEIDRADRYSYSLALVMMDVDHFKELNDAHGHLMGDKVLEFFAATIRGNIRRIDLAARYGGDEFVLVLPEITEQEAWLMGARLLNALKQSTLRSTDGKPVSVGVTMGVAMYASDARTARDLIEAADKALYWSKKSNRGDICFYKNVPKHAANSGP